MPFPICGVILDLNSPKASFNKYFSTPTFLIGVIAPIAACIIASIAARSATAAYRGSKSICERKTFFKSGANILTCNISKFEKTSLFSKKSINFLSITIISFSLGGGGTYPFCANSGLIKYVGFVKRECSLCFSFWLSGSTKFLIIPNAPDTPCFTLWGKVLVKGSNPCDIFDLRVENKLSFLCVMFSLRNRGHYLRL